MLQPAKLCIFLLLCTFVHAYKVSYCDSNGCAEAPISSILYSSGSFGHEPTPNTNFHEAAVNQRPESAKGTKASNKEWQIAVASVGSVMGVAAIAAAIFVLSHTKRRKGREDVYQEKVMDPEKSEETEKGIEPSISIISQEWKQLVSAAYRNGWYDKKGKGKEESRGAYSTPSFANSSDKMDFSAYDSTPNLKSLLTPAILKSPLHQQVVTSIKYNETMPRALNKLIQGDTESQVIPLEK